MAGCQLQPTSQTEPVDYVNPFMGGISHLLKPTYPTVHLPNSMLRVYPERNDITDDVIPGLPVLLTSHRGAFAFALSPYQGSKEDLRPVLNYSYDLEKYTPYSWSVFLDEALIEVDLAVSHQSALYQFEFQKEGETHLVIQTRNGAIRFEDGAVKGYQDLANNTRVYLYLVPNTSPVSVSAVDADHLTSDQAENSGRNAAIALHFDTNQLRVKYGVSFISEEQASRNLKREIEEFDRHALETEGRRIWNETLGKIAVEGGSAADRAVFYTSLYRTCERPVSISEDGRYFSAFDGQVHDDEGIPNYTDDWIWDTYRATHPLKLITDPLLEEHIIHSYLRMASQMEHFWMPTFPEVTGDGRKMNSNHGVAMVLDAWTKGVQGFDLEKAYLAAKLAITEKTLAPWSGMPAGELDDFYKLHGYIPALHEGEPETIREVHGFERRQPVAVTLGTVYDEWCLGRIAEILGKQEEAAYFLERSWNYRKLFHPETHFFHPKDSRGEWIMPFDYIYSGGQGARQFYSENNAWIYRWDVPHNVGDLVGLMGGSEAFANELDRMFRTPMGRQKFTFYAQLPDHTGNVGMFSMANEPSLHIPYLYNYAQQPWKTQKRIRTLLEQWFRNDLMGVPGDEDGGGMSAFVVFSQLGFYPVTPGLPVYNIGSPVFARSKTEVAPGRYFEVVAHNAHPNHKYIQSARLNGVEWNKPWFSHSDLIKGGKLELVMGAKPNRMWGSAAESAPPSYRYP